MIKKILAWLGKLPGHPKKEELSPWPFPVVIGTPPAAKKTVAKKRGRPALKKATTRKPKPAVVAKTVAKKTTKKKVK